MPQKLVTYGFWFYDELRSIIMSSDFRYIETPRGKFLTKVNSTRLRTLKQSPVCVACGKVGVFWMLQSHGPLSKKNAFRPHLNLFAVDEKNVLTLMTQDHILPKSRGGTNHKNNLQTMCTHCNNDKGDIHPDDYATSYRHSPSMDGRSVGSTGLLQIRQDALAVLDSLESTEKLRYQNAGQNLQLRPEYRY